jgi:HK97 family phage major capsid protein
MTLKEQLAEKKSALKALEENIKAGDKEAIAQGEEIAEAIKGLEASIAAAEKASALLAQIGKDAESTEEGTDMEAAKARTLGENFVNYLKNNAPVSKRFDVSAPSFKAATDTQTSPAGAVDFATTFDKNVVTGARTPLVIRDLFGAETISGSTLVYLVEGAIQGAPAVTAEGTEKPQVHFADPTPKTVSLAKVACHIKESDEYINDFPFLASAINGRLLYELGLVEQGKLVTDLLGTSGIQTGTYAATGTATDIADAILQAAMDVQNQTGFPADAIAMNPADWYILRVGKDGEDRYYGGGYFGDQSIPNIWGIPVCVSASITSGTVVVGAFKTCASVVTNGGVSVESTNTNEDDFVKNLMTIRAEERLALAVRRPAGFKKLTKASQ